MSLGAFPYFLKRVHLFKCAQLLVELFLDLYGSRLEVELVRFSYVRHTHIKVHLTEFILQQLACIFEEDLEKFELREVFISFIHSYRIVVYDICVDRVV